MNMSETSAHEAHANDAENERRLLDTFFLHAREWCWHTAFRALDATSLLVTDKAVQDAIEQAYGKLACRFIEPDDYLKCGPESADNTIIFCQYGEWHLTKRSRQQYPDKHIVSALYDLAPLGPLPDNKFPLDRLGSGEALVESKAPQRLLLAQAGSDVEYLSLLAKKNGFPATHKLAGRALKSWIEYCSSFHVVRFAVAALGHMPSEDHTTSLDLATLYAVLTYSPLTRRRLLDWLNEAGTSTLYFVSRDKFRQVALEQMMADKPFASLWDRSESVAQKLEGQDFDKAAAYEKLVAALTLEIQLELTLQGIDQYKFITLEELVEAPEEVLAAIGQFWGRTPPRNLAYLDWKARYGVVPEFRAQVAEFREETLKSLNLTDDTQQTGPLEQNHTSN